MYSKSILKSGNARFIQIKRVVHVDGTSGLWPCSQWPRSVCPRQGARPARASLAHAAAAGHELCPAVARRTPIRTVHVRRWGGDGGEWSPCAPLRPMPSAPHVLIVHPCRWAHVWLSRRSLPVPATRAGAVKAAALAVLGTVNCVTVMKGCDALAVPVMFSSNS